MRVREIEHSEVTKPSIKDLVGSRILSIKDLGDSLEIMISRSGTKYKITLFVDFDKAKFECPSCRELITIKDVEINLSPSIGVRVKEV